mmetsp:Transcript_4480/g.8553  ORF Transcript_4480/g.8553 Transcript_4480/m.8553 type:complete len:216 (-) Transcript_4480:53-700(-)
MEMSGSMSSSMSGMGSMSMSMDDDMHMNHDDDGGHGSTTHSMPMTFHSSTEVEVLFEGTLTDENWKYAVAIGLVLAGGFLRQWINLMRSGLDKRCKCLDAPAGRAKLTSTTPVAEPRDMEAGAPKTSTESRPAVGSQATGQGNFWAWLDERPLTRRFVQTLLFAVSLALSLLLMLVAMTYDSGLFCAVVGGEALGYATFSAGARRVNDEPEFHCA